MSKKIAYAYIGGHLTVVLHGHAHDVDKTHPKFQQILNCLKRPRVNGVVPAETDRDETARAKLLLSLIEASLITVPAGIGWDDVKVDHGVVTVKGKPMRTSLTQRILDLKAAGLPYDAFVNFLVNLEQNPSQESRESLFDFLEQGKFPLTDDGCFLGYKGVIEGTLNGKHTLVDQHSRKFDMSPGNIHEMPRDAVDDNRNQACGAGFHVGTIGHARGFGAHMIVVKVNPRDAVSVPTSDTTKLRCCKYEVVAEFQDARQAKELQLPVYTKDQYTSKDIEKVSSVAKPAETFDHLNRDQLVREAVDRGIVHSVNEARALGKELLIVCLTKGELCLDDMTIEDLAGLAARRHLFSSESAARKAGRARMLDAIREA